MQANIGPSHPEHLHYLVPEVVQALVAMHRSLFAKGEASLCRTPKRKRQIPLAIAACGVDGQPAPAKANLGAVEDPPLFRVNAPTVDKHRVANGLEILSGEAMSEIRSPL